MNNNTETKTNNLIPVSKEEFAEKVEDKLTIASYKELGKERDKKGLINISKLDVVANKLRPQIVRELMQKYRVKGTRTGHINHAPPHIQTTYNQCKELLENCQWSNDGDDYTISLIAKKVVEKEVKMPSAVA